MLNKIVGVEEVIQELKKQNEELKELLAQFSESAYAPKKCPNLYLILYLPIKLGVQIAPDNIRKLSRMCGRPLRNKCLSMSKE